MPNRLINETSPYLLQHAHNPVDWYPWGEEALRRAREEDKPILVSIGYSACHWCHVMERESFENEDVARVMNELVVSIKVDREERPDLDQVYMTAVQTLTGSGGWPLNVFITPEGKPIFGGTYFPPEDRDGAAGFPRVLRAVAQAYRTRREELSGAGEKLGAQLRRSLAPGPVVEPLTADVLKKAYRGLQTQFDYENGGFGAAPKFPHSMALDFLLRYYVRTNEPPALQIVEAALTAMARGGIHDQLGGGFHRYSTDAHWLAPHFEKMLYDNALLARLYLHAYQVTGKPLYRAVAADTLDYVVREMTSPEGGFYSAQDADSEGVEGKFYVWTQREILQVIGEEDARVFNRYFGVTKEGNFEGKSILYQPQGVEAIAEELGFKPQELEEIILRSKKRLLEARQRRVKPATDDKVLTAWNGLMLAAFAEAANILCTGHGSPCPYGDVARANANLMLCELKQGPLLLRSYKDGQAKIPGYLEDYANLIDGLLALHEATLELRWLAEARALADTMIDEFWDDSEKAFYDTGRHHEALFLRPREASDNVTPSGNSNAASVLLRLAVVTGNRDYAGLGATALRSAKGMMLDYPAGAGNWLSTLDFYLSAPKEIAIIGPRDDPRTAALLSAVYSRFIPGRVLVGRDTTLNEAVEGLPLLEGRDMVDGRPTVYICENYACLQPVTEPEELRRLLA
ncbi:MAG: thioredoxin domain-containing protein [Chloroflexi bacterium]|nr:thioredoxin domain-containing protein [Chloroflexota bacterium]